MNKTLLLILLLLLLLTYSISYRVASQFWSRSQSRIFVLFPWHFDGFHSYSCWGPLNCIICSWYNWSCVDVWCFYWCCCDCYICVCLSSASWCWIWSSRWLYWRKTFKKFKLQISYELKLTCDIKSFKIKIIYFISNYCKLISKKT